MFLVDNRVLSTILLPILWMVWIAGGVWAESPEGLLVDEQWIPATEFEIVDNVYYLPLIPSMTDYLGIDTKVASEKITIDRVPPRAPVYLGRRTASDVTFSFDEREVMMGGDTQNEIRLMKRGEILYLPLTEPVLKALSWQLQEKGLFTGWRPSSKVWLEEVGDWFEEKARDWRPTLQQDEMDRWHGETDELVYTIFENGDEVIGTHVKGSLEGVGLYRWGRDGTRYVGGFRNDKIHGIGRYTYAGGGRSPILFSKEGHSPFASNRFTDRQRSYRSKQPVLLVAVSYSDVTIRSSEELLADRLRALSDAWFDLTDGQHRLVPASEEVGEVNDGVVMVTVDHAHGGGFQGEDFMEEILRPLTDTVDFDSFDGNDDGILDPDELHIILVIAGRESELPADESSVLSHRRRLSSDDTRLTKWVDLPGYIVIGEIWETGELTPLGVFLHELGHNFNLPDLYGPPSPRGVGEFSLMARGYTSETSDGMMLDPFSRLYLGLVTAEERWPPTVYSPSRASITRIPLDGERYVLVERREKGLLFWIVDEEKVNERYDENRLNVDPQDQAIRLFRGYKSPYFSLERSFLVGFEGTIFRSDGIDKIQIYKP